MNSACDLRGLKIHSAMKNYTSAPLPFMGQKKRFIREFRKGQQWGDAHFRFNPKQYPDAEVIDLR